MNYVLQNFVTNLKSYLRNIFEIPLSPYLLNLQSYLVRHFEFHTTNFKYVTRYYSFKV